MTAAGADLEYALEEACRHNWRWARTQLKGHTHKEAVELNVADIPSDR